jgi:AAA family ATP:ADP antiporter
VLITGQLARKFGIKSLVAFVPLVMVFGFTVLALTGTLTVLAGVFILRRVLEYSFIRPGREMLWSPLDKETKYKAKNTVDVPVYRGSDALSAQASEAMASNFGAVGVAWLGALTAALWALLGLWLARRYESQPTVEETQRPIVSVTKSH